MSLKHYSFYGFICGYTDYCGTVTFCMNKTDLEKEIFISRQIKKCTNQRDHQWYADCESFLDDFSGHSISLSCAYIMEKWTSALMWHMCIHAIFCLIWHKNSREKNNAEKESIVGRGKLVTDLNRAINVTVFSCSTLAASFENSVY